MKFMKQCKLRKTVRGNQVDTISWVLEKLAHVGKRIWIENTKGVRDEGWHVEEVFQTSRTEEKYVKERSRDYLHHREATAI